MEDGVIVATICAMIAALLADHLIVAVAEFVSPATQTYGHFQFNDYARLTIIGVVGGCLGWYLLSWATEIPERLYLFLIILGTIVLWLPDAYIAYLGQPVIGVLALMVMHVAVAAVITLSVLLVAPVREKRYPL